MSEQDDSDQTGQSATADVREFDADRTAAELKLSEQDKAFALALLNGANQTQAARMAGFPQEGVALRKKASTLANTNKVQRFLERARASGAGLTPEEVVDRETRRLLLSRDATGHDRQVAMRAIEQLNKMDADETAEEAERAKQDVSPFDILDTIAEISPIYAAKLAKDNNLPPPLFSVDAIKKMHCPACAAKVARELGLIVLPETPPPAPRILGPGNDINGPLVSEANHG